jgi:glyoxylase-like metal-dependent hydrolase (beta-lactamase superfamily II)
MKRRFSSQFMGMNSSLIHNHKSAILVDPGVFPPEIERISDYLKQRNLTEISVALTHTHGDHISGWHAFKKYKTFVHSVVREKSEAIRNNDVRYLEGMYRKQKYQIPKDLKFPEPLLFNDDGEPVNIKPSDIYFYHVPGHSQDMSVIVIPEERLLLSGDMLILTPLPFILHSIRQYWQSLEKIRNIVDEVDLNYLIPGHGKPAETKDEILKRINNEKKYIRKLVTRGKNCIHNGNTQKELKQILQDCFPDLSSLHAHKSNIQTFIREHEDLQLEQFL